MADWLNRRHHSRERVKRHRHDEVGVGEQLGPGLGKPARVEWRGLLPIPIFKLWISSRMVSE